MPPKTPTDVAAPALIVTAMAHPEGGTSDAFETDAKGNILVPHDQVEALLSHGFLVVTK
jgi:hypothetical protein